MPKPKTTGEPDLADLPAMVPRDGLANYMSLVEATGVSHNSLRQWYTRDTAGLRTLALSGLAPPVWVRDEAVAAIRRHLGVG